MEKKVETAYFPVSSLLRNGYLDGVTLGMSFDRIESLWGENALFFPPRQPQVCHTNFGGIGMIFEKESLSLISMDIDFEIFSYRNYNKKESRTLDVEFLHHNLPEKEAEKYFSIFKLEYKKSNDESAFKDRKAIYTFASGVELLFLHDDYDEGLRYLQFNASNISAYLNSIPKYCGY